MGQGDAMEMEWAAGLDISLTNWFWESLEGSLDLDVLLQDNHLKLEM